MVFKYPTGAEEILNLDKIRDGWLRSLNNAVKNDRIVDSLLLGYAEPFKESGVWYIQSARRTGN